MGIDTSPEFLADVERARRAAAAIEKRLFQENPDGE